MTDIATPTIRALAACVQANVPVFLLGNPGQAKSATIRAMADAWGWHCETVVGSNRDRTDFLGTMIEVDGIVHYSQLGWAHRANAAKTTAPSRRALVFLDELTTTGPDVQKAMLRVIQERVVGETTLGDHVALVAAGNPPASAADGYDLEGPVANRFIHLEWAFNPDVWATGMLEGFDQIEYPTLTTMLGKPDPQWQATAQGLVVGFVKHQPQLLAPPPPSDPTLAGRAWPSPRMWTQAAKALGHTSPGDQDAQSLILEGAVGRAARIAFQEWAARMDLPSPEDMLDHPRDIEWGKMRTDQIFAALNALRSYLAYLELDAQDWEAGCQVAIAVASCGKPDVGLQLTSWLLNHRPPRATAPSELRDAYLTLFQDLGVMN